MSLVEWVAHVVERDEADEAAESWDAWDRGGYDGFALEELRRVMQGNTLRHPVHRHGTYSGGEWEALLELDVRTKRSLTGARYLTPGGLHPDEAHALIAEGVGETRIRSVADAVDWYVETCLAAIDQRRKVGAR